MMNRTENNSLIFIDVDETTTTTTIQVQASKCQLLRETFVSVYPVSVWKSEGFFDDADLLEINCHWLQFEPTKPSAHFLLAIIYVAVFVVGCVSNTLVVYILLSSKKLLTPANILLVNLAFSDLLIVLLIPIFIYNSFLQGPAIGGFGCRVYGFLSGFSGTSSILTLAAVAIDRYLVISRPLDLAKKPTRSWAYVTIALIWLYSATFASLPLLGAGKYVPEGYLTSCSFDYLSDDFETKIFILVFFFAAWVCPLAVIAYCYTAIIQAVYYVRQNVTSNTSALVSSDANSRSSPPRPVTDNTDAAAANLRDQKIYNHPLRGVNQPNVEVAIAKIVVGLIGSWIIAWTPYSLIALLGISGQVHLVTPFSSMLPALFAKTAACVDPFIYSLNHPKIRQEILYRLYNTFLLSTGRRGESLNSDSARIPDWKIGGSARTKRQGLVYQTGTQHGRVGSLASFRRFNLKDKQQAQSGGGMGGGSGSGKEDMMRQSISLSSAESRTINAEGLDSADMIATMIQCNQEVHRPFRNILSATEINRLSHQNNFVLAESYSPGLSQHATADIAISSLTSSEL